MTVSIRDVLGDPQLRKAEPVVEVEGGGLDTPVRWAFASEREDVSEFLSGGELLIVDGNALAGDGRNGAFERYAASLSDAGVAALAVELVQGVVVMPPGLVRAARRHKLTLIGLHARVPFVDISQSINTAIVHDHMHLQTELDTMSTSLREGLSHADDIGAVASTVASLFGEGVAIFDADGLPAAQAGRPFEHGREPGAVIALEGHSRPVGALEITQRTTTFTEAMRRAIGRIVSPVAALYIDAGARMGMIRRVSAGPADGIHVDAYEAGQAHTMLEALGFAGSTIYMPFTLRFRSVAGGIGRVDAMADDFERREGCAVTRMLEGDLMVGWLSAADPGDGVAAFGHRCVDALSSLRDDDIAVVHGKVALDTVALVDGFALLRDLASREPAYGRIESAMSGLADRFVATPGTDKAIDMLIAQTIGAEVADSPTMLDTLSACFDNLDGKTGACGRLGIGRQTLYNRLDKAERLTGVDQDDKAGWSMLLLAAKLAKSRGDRRRR